MPNYKLPDGTVINDSTPFRWKGFQYPENWIRLSTAEDRKALGLELLPDPKPYDPNFYWGRDANDALIPKNHVSLVEEYTDHIKRSAQAILADTDWMVIRKADTGIPIDPSVAAWRQSVRKASAEKIAALEATGTTAELASYVTGAEYSTWPTFEINSQD